jgi:hypothetical protein
VNANGKEGGSGGGSGGRGGGNTGIPGKAKDEGKWGWNGGDAGKSSAHDPGGGGGDGWKPAEEEGAAWIITATATTDNGKGTTEFSHGGRGGSLATKDSQPAANYGDGGSGQNGANAAGTAGHDGIVIVRFKRVAVRYSHVPLSPEKLDVFFNLGKFEPLMLADVETESLSSLKLTLAAASAVRLWPRYITDYFAPVAFSQNTDAPYIGVPKPPHSYSIKKLGDGFDDIAIYSPLFFTSAADLPQRDVDALLEFELKYRAFGVSDHGGKVWTIRNGLYNAPDDEPELGGDGAPTGRGAGAGSYIPVKFGAGTPAEKKGGGTVIYTK